METATNGQITELQQRLVGDLRRLMQQKSLRQGQLAHHCGISPGSMSDLMHEKRPFSGAAPRQIEPRPWRLYGHRGSPLQVPEAVSKDAAYRCRDPRAGPLLAGLRQHRHRQNHLYAAALCERADELADKVAEVVTRAIDEGALQGAPKSEVTRCQALT